MEQSKITAARVALALQCGNGILTLFDAFQDEPLQFLRAEARCKQDSHRIAAQAWLELRGDQ